MAKGGSKSTARSGRIRSALLVFGALLLFVAGLLLLFAPARAEEDQSRVSRPISLAVLTGG